MVHVERRRTGLYYVTGNGAVSWHWTQAPDSIRQRYRNRSDFWAVSPTCIARQWM